MGIAGRGWPAARHRRDLAGAVRHQRAFPAPSLRIGRGKADPPNGDGGGRLPALFRALADQVRRRADRHLQSRLGQPPQFVHRRPDRFADRAAVAAVRQAALHLAGIDQRRGRSGMDARSPHQQLDLQPEEGWQAAGISPDRHGQCHGDDDTLSRSPDAGDRRPRTGRYPVAGCAHRPGGRGARQGRDPQHALQTYRAASIARCDRQSRQERTDRADARGRQCDRCGGHPALDRGYRECAAAHAGPWQGYVDPARHHRRRHPAHSYL